jgi:hypothetical protein
VSDDRTMVDDATHDRDRDRLRDDDRHGGGHGTVSGGTMSAVRERQRDRFGGFSWGADFFGWLTAVGLSAILVAIASAAGTALALGENANAGDADTIGIAGGIAFLVILAIAYFCGGYVAGRMARFDGARQGIGVVLWGIIIAVLLAIAGAILGSEYNVFSQLNLPRLPIDEGDLTTGGLIALAAALITMFVSAILGGKLGERFHKKVDREAVH